MNSTPENKNLKATVVGDVYVSSALIYRYINALGRYVDTYETYIWEYDAANMKLGKLLHETYQRTEEESLKVHGYMVKNLMDAKNSVPVQ